MLQNNKETLNMSTTVAFSVDMNMKSCRHKSPSGAKVFKKTSYL